MLIMGGRTDTQDFDDTVLAYRYSCNDWWDVTAGMSSVYGTGIPAVIGAAAAAFPSDDGSYTDVYVMGGFNSLMQVTYFKISKFRRLISHLIFS